jgi:hypothetical protein
MPEETKKATGAKAEGEVAAAKVPTGMWECEFCPYFNDAKYDRCQNPDSSKSEGICGRFYIDWEAIRERKDRNKQNH